MDNINIAIVEPTVIVNGEVFINVNKTLPDMRKVLNDLIEDTTKSEKLHSFDAKDKDMMRMGINEAYHTIRLYLQNLSKKN